MTVTTQMLVEAARQEIDEITNEEVSFLLEDNIRVLDVREPAEFEAGHLPEAINIPRGVLEFQIGAHPMFTDKSQPILVYCQGGGRSALACQSLQQLGYNGVLSLQAGYAGWAAKNK